MARVQVSVATSRTADKPNLIAISGTAESTGQPSSAIHAGLGCPRASPPRIHALRGKTQAQNLSGNVDLLGDL